MTEKQNLETIKENLDVALELYDSATQKYEAARSHQTAMLNSLNTAQKEFDKAIRAIKDTAPQNTDWWRSDNSHEVFVG